MPLEMSPNFWRLRGPDPMDRWVADEPAPRSLMRT